MTQQKAVNFSVPNFKNLPQHWRRLRSTSIKTLFQEDPSRFKTMSLQVEDVLFDFSKTHLDQSALSELLELAKSAGLEDMRDQLFSGGKINVTEGRAALHTALRNKSDKSVYLDGKDVMPDVHEQLSHMADFSDLVRSGEYTPSGKRIADIVNIGIGGSDLGPHMAVSALQPFCDGPKIHFVSNVDGADIADTIATLDPTTTLFVVASKTFTTQETMANAKTAMEWVTTTVGNTAGSHFCALSTNLEATEQFGIASERTFGFWDWVGGRYSVWSSIGLSLMMAIGADAFHEFLDGAYRADQHFAEAEQSKNIPVLMALIGIWHRNICGFPAFAMLPYDNRLALFPRWLQQLDMESNGKSKTHAGEPVDYKTGPIVFGEPGTNGQHAFYQLLHQGTDITPCDFLISANGHEPQLDHQHKMLLANCLAQSEALMKGQTIEEANGDPQREFSGDRPSCTFLYSSLTPGTLGMLMAFYEHKIFVQGVIWGINSFDQFGVELGKNLGKGIEALIEENTPDRADNTSTEGLLNHAMSLRKT